MSTKSGLQSSMQESWSKLSQRWQGADAQAFHSQYVVKISETIEDFEHSCDKLTDLSSAFLKELQNLVHSVAE